MVAIMRSVAPGWVNLRRRLVTEARILVVDDEPSVLMLLHHVLAGEGFTVEGADTAEQAWELVQAQRYDLLVSDKNLPGESGIDLIARVARARIALPSILVTGYASIESAAEAFACGATDYLAKPFDIAHFGNRVRAVMHRRVGTLVFQAIIRDLTAIARSGAIDEQLLADLQRRLFCYKIDLGSGPDVLLVGGPGESPPELKAVVDEAALCGVSVSLDEALGWTREPAAPRAAVVDLDCPDPIGVIQTLRQADGLLEILALTRSGPAGDALAAITAGAADFVALQHEGSLPLLRRLQRLVGRSRHRRLYLHLMGTLYELAQAQDEEAARMVLDAAAPAERDYVLRVHPTRAREIESGDDLLGYVAGEGWSGWCEGDPLGRAPLHEVATITE